MHSRIYQITKNPIDEDERLYSSIVPEWFCNVIADYVDDGCNRDDDIGWLKRTLGDIVSVDGEKFTFSSDVTGFFSNRHKAFVEAAEKLSKMPLEDFASYKDCAFVRNLNNAYSDEYGFYVYDDDECLDTLEDFMRRVSGGETYYIGGIVDYHF